MSPDYAAPAVPRQDHAVAAQASQHLLRFLTPLVQLLDAQVDARLARTFVAAVGAIVMWRHRNLGLLLSELGSYLVGPAHAPAGTKRLSNLLRSPKWQATLIADWLWQHADVEVRRLHADGDDPLVVWDQSVLEKPESQAGDDFCAVRSSKARRLTRLRPGFFTPPLGRPVFVAGLHWLGLLVVSAGGPPMVAAMQWWTTRGDHATERRTVERRMLERCRDTWGREVCHLFDRGFAGAPWLTLVLEANLRFVLRWPKRYKLLDQWAEERKAWEIVRGKRSWNYRWLHDTRTREVRKVGVVAVSVCHAAHARPLWLVVARPGKGREPWYLLTSDPIYTSEAAWTVVLAYTRRWQIEMTWRYSKSELAFESPRLWTWERREKLLLLATLAYAFLLSLLVPAMNELRAHLLRYGCHRTGSRSQEAALPLYRLRSAISRLWLAYRNNMSHPQNSG